MRKKQRKVILTFPSTEYAMNAEEICHADGLPGRLIPVPSEITAGCGLAWMADPEEKEGLVRHLRGQGIEPEGVYEMLI